MSGRPIPGWRGLALHLVAGAIVAVLAAVAFAWSGIYDVGARSGHWPITHRFIEFALRQSVATHSLGIETPPLDDADLVRLGAGHFASGCAPCHGAPGMPTNPIVRGMLPAPPRLSDAVRRWQTRELFWIVQNGLKYTGMPAWPAPQRDDEIWAVVAFLARLPELDPAEYNVLARGATRAREDRVSDLGRLGASPPAAAECVRCHGDEASRPTSRLVPELSVLPARYIEMALHHYAGRLRPSGIMQPMAARLGEREIERLAAYYANLSGDRGDPLSRGAVDPERIERGRIIATAGVPKEGVPPCLACHGARASEIFPRLAGQQAPYISGQLALWQRGLRTRSVTGAIMAPIARRLTGDQIEDVAAYFESLPESTHDPEATDLVDDASRSGSP